LSSPCSHNPKPNGSRSLTRWAAQLLCPNSGNGNPKIEPVDERTAQSTSIPFNGAGRTAARTTFISQVAARAGVGGGHQLDASRKGHRCSFAGYVHHTLFDRLSQRIQQMRWKLSQFIEKQDPTIGQRQLSRDRDT
jgi:hypothetical protein